MRGGLVGATQLHQLQDKQHGHDDPEGPGEVGVPARALPTVGEHLGDIDVGEVPRRHVVAAAGALEVGHSQAGGHVLELGGIGLGDRGLAGALVHDVLRVRTGVGGLPDLELAHLAAVGRPVAENGTTIDHRAQLVPRQPGRAGLRGGGAVVGGLTVGQDVDEPGRLGAVLGAGAQVLRQLRQRPLQGGPAGPHRLLLLQGVDPRGHGVEVGGQRELARGGGVQGDDGEAGGGEGVADGGQVLPHAVEPRAPTVAGAAGPVLGRHRPGAVDDEVDLEVRHGTRLGDRHAGPGHDQNRHNRQHHAPAPGPPRTGIGITAQTPARRPGQRRRQQHGHGDDQGPPPALEHGLEDHARLQAVRTRSTVTTATSQAAGVCGTSVIRTSVSPSSTVAWSVSSSLTILSTASGSSTS